MKKILFVNSDMKVGGVQKSLLNLLWEISGRYDVTLLLFSPQGAYLKQLPPDVMQSVNSMLGSLFPTGRLPVAVTPCQPL